MKVVSSDPISAALPTVDRTRGSKPLLEVRGLVVSYGSIKALREIDFEVYPGEIVTIAGANGAGKTTLLKTIAGVLRPAQGSIDLKGQEIGNLPPTQCVRRGVSLVPEGRLPFTDLTVRENLLLGAYLHTGVWVSKGVDAKLDGVFDLFPRLAERREQAAGTLSGGEQQMLVIGRALMSQPLLLLCDEPSLGLAPLVIRDILQTLRQLADRGMTVLLADQNVRASLELADHAYVLETGRVALSGPASALLNDPLVINTYLG
jgi:branched-chain amino acid transport system ATP-binding protein